MVKERFLIDQSSLSPFEAAYTRLIKANGENKIPIREIDRRFTELYHTLVALGESSASSNRNIAEQFDQIYTSRVKPAQDPNQEGHTVPINGTRKLPRKSTSYAEASHGYSGQQNESEEPTSYPNVISTITPKTDSLASKSTRKLPIKTTKATKAAVDRSKLSTNSNALSRNVPNPTYQFSDEDEL
ncbi:MAG: hypothetical protein M1835_001857 [Candelina submexicana]|nr:MAG: hypothetical protein M1835_001857 [Candelina submexicana]